MDYSTNDKTVYPDFSTTTNNDSNIIVLDDDENGDQYLSKVWFSDIDENLDDLVDEIVINEDIYKAMNCDSGDIMTSDQELETVTKNCNHPTTTSDSTEEDNDNLVQQTQQKQKPFQKQEKQQNKPNMQIIEAQNNEQEHVIVQIEKYFKGENAEHEIIYRVKLPKKLIVK